MCHMALCLHRFIALPPPLIVLTPVVGAWERYLFLTFRQQAHMADPWQLREHILQLRCT